MEALEMGYMGGAMVAGYIGHGLIGNGIASYQLRQEKLHHAEGIELDKAQHQAEMKKTQEIHEAEVAEARRLCIAERNTELKQHFQALNADLINSNREAERDMYEQRNSQFQTIIVASTVMFGALCTVIIEGNLPLETGKVETIILMAFSGTSFALLFMCMVLSLKLILRSSRFMYTRASVHNRVVHKLARDTVRMLAKMDNDMKDYDRLPPDVMWKDHVNRVDEYLTWRQEINDMLFGNLKRGQRLTVVSPGLTAENFSHFPPNRQIPRHASQQPPLGIPRQTSLQSQNSQGTSLREEDFLVDEDVDLESLPSGLPVLGIGNYSQDTSFRSIQYAEAKASLGSFETFWNKHCATYAFFALRLFYMGMVSLLISLGLLMFAKLSKDYDNLAAALTFSSFLFISVVGTICVLARIKNKITAENILEQHDPDDHVIEIFPPGQSASMSSLPSNVSSRRKMMQQSFRQLAADD